MKKMKKQTKIILRILKYLAEKKVAKAWNSDKARITAYREIWKKKKLLRRIYFDKWKDMMAYNIALNGSFFNTHRMVSQYVMQAYFR